MTDSTPPLVSIAVTTYNGGKYLREQLDSLFAQDYPNLEVVVSDDQSSDETIAILKEYESRSNFRWWQNEKNLGYIKNFELVISKCVGEYVALCDQDDVWYVNKVSKSLAVLQEADALLAYCDADLIDRDGEHIEMNLLSHSPVGPIVAGEYEKFYLLNTVNGCCSIFKRDLFEMAAQFPDDMPHDWWLAYLAAFERRLAFVDERLLGYRMHENNTVGISYRVKKRNLKQYFRRKIGRYSKRFIYDKTVRPEKWAHECLQRFERFRHYEQSKQCDTKILDTLVLWMRDKLANSDRVSSYRPFFEKYHDALGVKLRSLLFMTMKSELKRAKIKLVYTLLSPVVAVSVIVFALIWVIS